MQRGPGSGADAGVGQRNQIRILGGDLKGENHGISATGEEDDRRVHVVMRDQDGRVGIEVHHFIKDEKKKGDIYFKMTGFA